jgi:hypothetical protein
LEKYLILFPIHNLILYHGVKKMSTLPNRQQFKVSPSGLVPPAKSGILYDIENDLLLEARIEPVKVDEGTLAGEHIRKLAGGWGYLNASLPVVQGIAVNSLSYK